MDRPSEHEIAAMLARLSDYAYVQVRSGVHDLRRLRELIREAAATEISDPERAGEVARAVLSREMQDWHDEAGRWGARTDCDRLDRALGQIADEGILVLPGLVDERSLAESVRVRDSEEGCVAYLVTDIWRAIDSNALGLTVLDGDGQVAGRRCVLLRRVIDVLGDAGLLGSVGAADGHVDVAMVWRRRPPQ